MKKAVLDIGSNSIKYLLVDFGKRQQLQVLKDESATTRLAHGIEKTQMLGEEAMAETLRVTDGYADDARGVGAEKIIAVATSAARDARNRTDFETRFKEITGVDLLVLTGIQESTLIFKGAISDPAFPQEDVVVMDVGGGSAEWILGRKGQIVEQCSLPLGCVRLTERFLVGDPYSEGSFYEMTHFLEKEIYGIGESFRLENRGLVATGGSACALAGLTCAMENRHEPVHGCLLDLDQVEAYVDLLRHTPLKEREKLPGIPPGRADIVTAGAAVFAAAMRVLGAERVMVSARGLRYGALYM